MAGLVSDKTILKQALQGLIEGNSYSSGNLSNLGGAPGPVSQLATKPYTANLTDGGTAATAVPETLVSSINPAASDTARLSSVQCTFPAAVAANGANYATVTLYKRAVANPGVPRTVASFTTSATSATAWLAAPATLAATADILFQPGDVLTATVTKAGTGVALGAFNVTAQLEEI